MNEIQENIINKKLRKLNSYSVRLTYYIYSNDMGFVLNAKDEDDRILFTRIFQSISELYSYISGIMEVLDNKNEWRF